MRMIQNPPTLNPDKAMLSVTEPLESIDADTILQALHAPYIVFSTDDPDFTVIEVNKAYAKMVHVERSEMIGRSLRAMMADAGDEFKTAASRQIIESIRKVIRTKKPDNMPRFRYDLDGTDGPRTATFWSTTHYPIFGRNREVIAVYQDAQDTTDQAAISQRLDRAEHQLSQMLASSLLGTWSWDIADGIVYTDANLAKLFALPTRGAEKGLAIDEFIGLIHPDDQRKVQVAIDKTLKTKDPYEAEHRIVSLKKETRWVISRGYVEHDKSGKPHLFSGVMFDITDRKRAEQAVAESEKRLRFMADAMPQLSWIARPDGYREYFNKQWYEFTGTTFAQVRGNGWQQLLHPGDKERVEDTWKRSYREGVMYEIEYRLYHAPSRAYRWVIGRALPYRNDAGRIVNWYGTSTDIHEQKRAAQIQTFLADVSKELASTLDYTTMLKEVTQLCVPALADWCAIDLYDEEKEAFEQVSLAHSNPDKIALAREFSERNPADINSPTGVPNVIRTGKTEYYPRITKELLEQYIDDEEILEFMVSLNMHSMIIAPLRISNKVVGGISFVASDSGRYYTESDLHLIEELAARISLGITNSKLYDDSRRELEKRQQVERELLQEKESLEAKVHARTEQRVQHLVELNRSKDEFISIASHQLRTPATGVKQYVGMLLEGFVGELTPKQHQLLEKAYNSNERQLKIVTDLLRVAQVDAGKVVLKKAKVKLNGFIDEIIRDHHTVFSDRDQTILYTPTHPDITISIDEASIRMVLENLIDNASKYSEDGTHVSVTVKDRGDSVSIGIRDQGVGIDPDGHARLFEKFSRINNPLSTKVGGTGLGLYWAKKIVDLHGGKISHRSNKSGGTTFSIKLPKK